MILLFATILQRSLLRKYLKGGSVSRLVAFSLEVRFRSGLDQRQWWRMAWGGITSTDFFKTCDARHAWRLFGTQKTT